ncbi:hypothetical protein [Nereida sp. MMG025]|uniref:hypothetical protein n=1 Tax=Nereida sp. MMG025 TaxID=2909981 RepID=UPI001F3FA200|nr:hypothetical protein [Nereida sp. MMG025]MCF6445697.1 hypothetical protein [Nereida sp. MMG025]
MKLIWDYRAQLVIVAVFVASLHVPHQLRDVMRAVVMEPGANFVPIILAGFALFLLSNRLFTTSEQVRDRRDGPFAWFAALVTTTPLVALAWCCVRGAWDVPATGVDYRSSLLAFNILGWMGLVAGAVVFWWLLKRTRSEPGKIDSEEQVSFFARAVSYLSGFLLVVFLIAPFFDEVWFVSIAQWTGPLAISWFALLLYLIALSWLTETGERSGVPLVTILVEAIVLFQWLGWNDNHDVREIASDSEPQELEAAFLAWYEGRKALAPDHPVPVVIVATQGGGIYAARHSATVLARLQDDCPAFAQNLFAISSVSGGSVGAAVFAAAVSDLDPELKVPSCGEGGGTAYQDYVEAALYRDFLSPTLWLWLLPEMIQVLIPFPDIGAYDRALGLEHGLESTAHKGSSFYTDGVLDSWSANKAVPALFLNTARTNTGQQLYVSPLTLTKFPGSQTRTDSLHEYRQDPFDLRVRTAAGLSARFPVVSSVGRFTASVRNANNEPLDPANHTPALYDEERLALVDGGFADNSGGDTALRIFHRVATLVAEHALDVKLEIVFIGDVSFRYTDLLRWINSITELSEIEDPRYFALIPAGGDQDDGAHILTPVLALNNARSDRSRLAIEEATEVNNLVAEIARSVCTSLFPDASEGDADLRRCFELRGRFFAGRTPISYSEPHGTVPLGWMLSRLSDDRVAKLRLGSEFNYDLCGALPDQQLDILHDYGETLLAGYDRQQNACRMNTLLRKMDVIKD